VRRSRLIGWATALGVAGALAGSSSALGFEGNFDYVGSITGHPLGNVGFKIAKTASGHRRVAHFTASSLPITCSDDPATTSTGGYEFGRGMRVVHHSFSGSGDWIVIALDPTGSVGGTFKDNAHVRGTFKLRGELAGPGTHCHTGELKWHAGKAL
jgi:hypothetical protein